MSDLAFAAAARPTPPTVLRVQLLPYSIGHELLLQSSQNPLLDAEEVFNRLALKDQCAAIMRAVAICSRTWQQNQKPDRWIRLWGFLIRNEDPGRAMVAFLNYRALGSLCPRFPDPEWCPDKSGGRALGSPIIAALLNFAIDRFENPFDQPLGLIQFLYFAQAEHDGNCRVENRDERETREQGEKHLADIIRERAERQAKEAQCQP